MSAPVQIASYDCGDCVNCRDTLLQLFQAYTDLLAGARARVRFGTRWSEYHMGNADGLRMLYQQIYAQCPDRHGLPNLAKGAAMRRGPPGVVPTRSTFIRVA